MEKEVATYIRKHTFLITAVVVGVFLLLAFGEYFLYRKTQELNKMVSEGMMQIKDELRYGPKTSDDLTLPEEKMMEKK